MKTGLKTRPGLLLYCLEKWELFLRSHNCPKGPQQLCYIFKMQSVAVDRCKRQLMALEAHREKTQWGNRKLQNCRRNFVKKYTAESCFSCWVNYPFKTGYLKEYFVLVVIIIGQIVAYITFSKCGILSQETHILIADSPVGWLDFCLQKEVDLIHLF